MATPIAVPMNPEGFAAMVSRHVRTWGSKAFALVKKTGRGMARVANWLHVTQAVRWTASKAAWVAGKAWHYAKVPLALVVPPVAAMMVAPEFVAVLLILMCVGLGVTAFWLWRIHKELKKRAPEETAGLIEDLRQRLRESQEELEAARKVRGQKAPEPEVVEGEVVEETPSDLEILEEILEESDSEPSEEFTRDEAVQASLEVHHQGEFPDQTREELPVPYEILLARWTELIKLAEEASGAEDVGLYSEINGRMAVVLIRTGDEGNKLYPDASWSEIHRDNRETQEKLWPDYPWDLPRMSAGSQKESKLLKELAVKAKNVT